MYLFITYGYPGMRGVQTKAIRLAQYLIKKGNVVKFYDDGDHHPLIKSKLDFENWDFNALYSCEQISFPPKIKAVIFCDLPTNRVGQLAIYLAAKSKNIPVVVIDNLYRPGQMQERVFSNIIDYSDLVIFNGLVLPKLSLPAHVTILGPFMSSPRSNKEIWDWLESLNINRGRTIIIGAGYNKDVLAELQKLSRRLKDQKIIILALGATGKARIENNLIYLPFLNDQQVSDLLKIASLVIGKYGFAQVIEALTAKVPIIVSGAMRGFQIEWLDPQLKELIIEAKDSDQLYTKTIEIIHKKNIYQNFLRKINKLTFVANNSLEKMEKLLTNITPRKIKIIKEVIVAFDDNLSLRKLKNLLVHYPFALPIVFSIPYLRSAEEKMNKLDLRQFTIGPENEILQGDFQVIYRSSLNSFHGAASILPHFCNLVNNLKILLRQADQIIYVDEKVESFIKPLIIDHDKGGL